MIGVERKRFAPSLTNPIFINVQVVAKNMESVKHREKCSYCGKEFTLTGKGKWREDIKAYEWYESNHNCPEKKKDISDNAKLLGAIGGAMTAKKYGAKHFSEAGKKGMKARWGK